MMCHFNRHITSLSLLSRTDGAMKGLTSFLKVSHLAPGPFFKKNSKSLSPKLLKPLHAGERSCGFLVKFQPQSSNFSSKLLRGRLSQFPEEGSDSPMLGDFTEGLIL